MWRVGEPTLLALRFAHVPWWCRDRIILLNRLTTLINFWQDEVVKHTVDEARMEFPDCAFALA
jgi:30S ribosomal protein 3